MRETARVEIFDREGSAGGWLGGNHQWWFDPSLPHAFSIFDLNAFYEDTYFAKDHVSPDVAARYVDHVLAYGQRFLGRAVESVLELGSGGGWFSEEFVRRGVDLVAVEGTQIGHRHTIDRAGPDRAIRHDLRRRLDLDRTFDIAVCTEVAEHIEPPFSSQLVDNLVRHSDLVWFSFAPPGADEAHYHHPNEQPERFWVNLFRFFGFHSARLPAAVQAELMGRGNQVCYRPPLQAPDGLSEVAFIEPGEAAGRKRIDSATRRVARMLVPPAWHALRARLRRRRR